MGCSGPDQEDAMNKVYRNDLAYIHDAGFGHTARSGAAFLVDNLRRNGMEAGRVIELGGGSGIASEVIAAAGFDVLGFDLSEDMLALAQQRVPRGEFRTESFVKAELPSCIAVTAIGEPFNYLFDLQNTKSALAKVFRRIY